MSDEDILRRRAFCEKFCCFRNDVMKIEWMDIEFEFAGFYP